MQKSSDASTASGYTEVSFVLPPVIHINTGTEFSLASTLEQDEELEKRFSAPDMEDDVADGGEDGVWSKAIMPA